MKVNDWYRQQETERAKRLLRHYLYMAGVPHGSDGDVDYEIGEIVDAIINAARGAA